MWQKIVREVVYFDILNSKKKPHCQNMVVMTTWNSTNNEMLCQIVPKEVLVAFVCIFKRCIRSKFEWAGGFSHKGLFPQAILDAILAVILKGNFKLIVYKFAWLSRCDCALEISTAAWAVYASCEHTEHVKSRSRKHLRWHCIAS